MTIEERIVHTRLSLLREQLWHVSLPPSEAAHARRALVNAENCLTWAGKRREAQRQEDELANARTYLRLAEDIIERNAAHAD